MSGCVDSHAGQGPPPCLQRPGLQGTRPGVRGEFKPYVHTAGHREACWSFPMIGLVNKTLGD